MPVIQTDEGVIYDISKLKSISIGRDDNNDIALDWKSVSKQHAIISSDVDGKYFIEDCRSRNGTFIGRGSNDDMLAISDPVELHDEDYIQFGVSKRFFRFFLEAPTLETGKNIVRSKQTDTQFSRVIGATNPHHDNIEQADEDPSEEIAILPTLDDSVLQGKTARSSSVPQSFTIRSRETKPINQSIELPGRQSEKMVEFTDDNVKKSNIDDSFKAQSVYEKVKDSYATHNLNNTGNRSWGISILNDLKPSSTPLRSKIGDANLAVSSDNSGVVFRSRSISNVSHLIIRRKFADDFNIEEDENYIETFVNLILGRSKTINDDFSRRPIDLCEDYGWSDIEQLADFDRFTKGESSKPKEYRSNTLPEEIVLELPEIIPSEVIAEAVADMMNNDRTSVVGFLNEAINHLNSLFEQMQAGVNIDIIKDTATSLDIKNALDSLILSLLERTLSNLTNALHSDLIKCLTSFRSRGVPNEIGLVLVISCESLQRFIDFYKRLFPSKVKVSRLSDQDIFRVSFYVIDNLLTYIDVCNVFIHQLYVISDEQVVRTSVQSNLKSNSLQEEVNVLREMKLSDDSGKSIKHRLSKITEEGNKASPLSSSSSSRNSLRTKYFQSVLRRNHSDSKNLAFQIWSDQTRDKQLKDKKVFSLLKIFDKRISKTLYSSFIIWKQYVISLLERESSKKLSLRRCIDIVFRSQYRALFHAFKKWQEILANDEELVGPMSLYRPSDIEYQQRLVIYSLEAKIRDLLDESNVAKALYAEKAMNNELLTVNNELKNALIANNVPKSNIKSIDESYSANVTAINNNEVPGDRNMFRIQELLAEERRKNQILEEELRKLKAYSSRHDLRNIKGSDEEKQSNLNQETKTQSKSKLFKLTNMSSKNAMNIVFHELQRLHNALESKDRELDQLTNELQNEIQSHYELRIGMQTIERKFSMQQRNCHNFINRLRKRIPIKTIVNVFDEMENEDPGSTYVFNSGLQVQVNPFIPP